MPRAFQSLGLPEPLVRALSGRGIAEPFPIQSSAIPRGLEGLDVQGRAPTGSGKTLAFGLPLLARVEKGRSKRPRALILAPTRELAQQIKEDLAPMAGAVDRRIAVVYGGVGYDPQRKVLTRGADVLVATPGRLEDLVARRWVDLREVDIVVIDEADRMADMGFLPAVRRILGQTDRNRQTMLFSATLDGDVAELARESQRDPVSVVAEASHENQLDVTHRFWRVARSDRVAVAAKVIGDSGRTIVFTRTRRGADRLVRQLGGSEIQAVPMHGGRSQNQRTRALRAFANGKARALVATDVAARGIHVEDIDVVLHYDLAADHKDYVHRSGRTARAGSSGTVISLVVDGQEKEARKIQRAIDIKAPIESPGAVLQRSGSRGATRRPTSRPTTDTDHRSHPSDGPFGSGVMSIFVGNLPWRATGSDLEELFAEHGTVEKSAIVTHPKSGRSKGFGFVEMATDAGHAAIGALNGAELDGRSLRVRVAR